MKIGIDIQSTVGFRTGIGYYAAALIEELKKIIGLELYFYKGGSSGDLNTAERMWWENVSLPRLAARDKPDILHIPGFAGPFSAPRAKKVTTVHDLIGMIYPGNLAPVSRFYWQRWLPACVAKSDLILADSQNTKKDIIRFLKVPERKIKVVYLAVNKSFRPMAAKEDRRKDLLKYGIRGAYILNVGTMEPRKNIAGLIRAFAAYRRGARAAGVSLVIVGKKGWAYAECAAAAAACGARENIVFCDYIDSDDLVLMYNLAEAFVYPSFYEGFGLPVLEAMSCGTPVISSNTSSLPELTSDAAMLIDPNDNAAISGAIAKLLSDERLKKTLAEKALVQASRFSWEKTARETADAYREAAGK